MLKPKLTLFFQKKVQQKAKEKENERFYWLCTTFYYIANSLNDYCYYISICASAKTRNAIRNMPIHIKKRCKLHVECFMSKTIEA